VIQLSDAFERAAARAQQAGRRLGVVPARDRGGEPTSDAIPAGREAAGAGGLEYAALTAAVPGRLAGIRAVLRRPLAPIASAGSVPVFLLVSGLLLVAYSQLGGSAQNVLYAAICLFALAVMALAIRRHRPVPLSAWIPVGVGLALFVIGDVLWATWELLSGETPFPSPADAFFLAAYPFLLFGITKLTWARRASEDRLGFLDTAIVTIAFLLLAWSFVIDPYLADTTLGPAALAVSVAYPVLDVALFGAALHVLVENEAATEQVRAALAKNGVEVRSVAVITPSLEDVFVALIEEADREG